MQRTNVYGIMLVYIIDIFFLFCFFEMKDKSCMFILLTSNVVLDQKYVLTYDYFRFYDGHEICIDFVKF